jgi:hypothetical protein
VDGRRDADVNAVQRLWRTLDGRVVDEGHEDAAFLLAGVGDPIPDGFDVPDELLVPLEDGETEDDEAPAGDTDTDTDAEDDGPDDESSPAVEDPPVEEVPPPAGEAPAPAVRRRGSRG